MSERAAVLIRTWGARLQDQALMTRILTAVHEREKDVQLCALDGLQRENPAFARAAGEQFRSEAVGHCNDIGKTIFAIGTGNGATLGKDPFSFVRSHAIRRARQQFPLAGSLNAYRLAHKGYWTVMRETVLRVAANDQEINACSMALSEFLLEFFDLVSGIMTDAYLDEEKRIVGRPRRARVVLIDDLLHGRQTGDLEARDLGERCGLRAGMHIAVAIVRPLNALPKDSAEREASLRHLSERVESALSAHGLGAVVDCRDGGVLAITAAESNCTRRVAGALRASLPNRRNDRTSAVAVGIGSEVTEIAAVPQAYQEAERAVEFSEPRRQIVHFADIDLVELLLRRPDTTALRLVPEWAGRLREADGKKCGDLVRTIRAFAHCDLNVKRTARSLKLHTNTIYFRLNRIKTLTGVDPRSFSGASLLLAALQLLDAKIGVNGSERRGEV
jgi:PucR C-terminal helix-turn-helix domain/GGDEF-like domain